MTNLLLLSAILNVACAAMNVRNCRRNIRAAEANIRAAERLAPDTLVAQLKGDHTDLVLSHKRRLGKR